VREHVRRSIEAHLGSRQVARVIYGAIIGMALVVSLEAHPPRPGVVAGTLLATAVAVGLAELYSEVVGAETRNRRRVGRHELGHILRDVTAVGFGIAFPAVFFFLAAAGMLEDDTAFVVAKWSGLGLISFYGFIAGRLSGAGLWVSALEALAVGVIGGVLIAFKALVH
jgi:VIT1/CCC1 family predicted Fe2+/Mn2+ transporter